MIRTVSQSVNVSRVKSPSYHQHLCTLPEHFTGHFEQQHGCPVVFDPFVRVFRSGLELVKVQCRLRALYRFLPMPLPASYRMPMRDNIRSQSLPISRRIPTTFGPASHHKSTVKAGYVVVDTFWARNFFRSASVASHCFVLPAACLLTQNQNPQFSATRQIVVELQLHYGLFCRKLSYLHHHPACLPQGSGPPLHAPRAATTSGSA